MKTMFIICIAILIFAIFTYDKWSYKNWYERCKINSKHPEWTPNCGIDFMKKDPQWFINNGYSKYLNR